MYFFKERIRNSRLFRMYSPLGLGEARAFSSAKVDLDNNLKNQPNGKGEMLTLRHNPIVVVLKIHVIKLM
jgi:hypothetical protein